MTTLQKNPHLNVADNMDEALERLLDWGEPTNVCDRLSAAELLAKAEASHDPLKLELASRYAASLGR